jgi:poly(3-hydroxyalkanoate) depolymerase
VTGVRAVVPTRLVDVGRQQLRVAVRAGEGDRTPLLLMNGIGAPLETLQPFVDGLDASLEVIRFDVPGVGGSALPAFPYRPWWLARLVGRLLENLGYDEVDVLGISWGGGLAQQFALSERRRCRRLVLVATGAGAVMVPGSPRVLANMVTPRRYWDRRYMLRIAPDLYGGAARADPASLALLLQSFGPPVRGRGYAYQLGAIVGWTSVPFLPFLHQPTLVLTGDDDPIVPAANGRILAALIPNAELHVYPGGHIDLVANPDLLVPRIDRFLAKGDPS